MVDRNFDFALFQGFPDIYVPQPLRRNHLETSFISSNVTSQIIEHQPWGTPGDLPAIAGVLGENAGDVVWQHKPTFASESPRLP